MAGRAAPHSEAGATGVDRELTMPRILQYPSADTVMEICFHDPVPVPYVLALLSFSDLLLCRGKLRTAAHANRTGDLQLRKQMLKRLFIVTTSMHSLPVLALFLKRLDLVGAAQRPRAADVDVSFFLEVGQLEVSQHRNTVVVGVVVMPLVAVGMDEKYIVRKGIVVVNYVSTPALHVSARASEGRGGTCVRYTMLSLPLFFGTVSGALGSSTL